MKKLQKTGNAILSANIYNNLGVLQYLLGQYDRAITSLDKALQYAKIAGYPRLEGYSLTSIGDLYRDLGALQQARDSYTLTWQVIRSIQDQPLELYQYLSQSALERISGNFDVAAENVNQARLKIGPKGTAYEIALCDLEDAALAIRQKKFDDVTERLQKAYVIFEKGGHLLEADKSDLLLLISSNGSDAKQRTKKIANHLFAKTISETSIHALLILGIEFKEFLESIDRSIQPNKGLSNFLLEVEELERKIPDIRKSLRGKTSFIPSTQAHIVIRTLGRIQIKVGDRLITTADWRTQTSRDFFLYLLAHPEGTTKEEIAEIFWPYGTGRSHPAAIQKYDLPRAQGSGGGLYFVHR